MDIKLIVTLYNVSNWFTFYLGQINYIVFWVITILQFIYAYFLLYKSSHIVRTVLISIAYYNKFQNFPK